MVVQTKVPFHPTRGAAHSLLTHCTPHAHTPRHARSTPEAARRTQTREMIMKCAREALIARTRTCTVVHQGNKASSLRASARLRLSSSGGNRPETSIWLQQVTAPGRIITVIFFFLGSGSLFNGHADPGTHMPGYKTPYPDAHPASRRPRPARGTPARRSHTPRGQTETATLPLTWSRVRDGRLSICV